MTERWRPFPDWEEFYEISDHGRVRTIPRSVKNGQGGGRLVSAKIRQQGQLKAGYKIIVLSAPGRRTTKTVHPMVLEAFIGPRPDGQEACHNDGDNANNRLTNLRWDTPEANKADGVRHGVYRDAKAATHCVNGHEYAVVGVYSSSRGKRCAECGRINSCRYRTGKQ